MEGNVSSPKVLVKARKIWSNPLEDDQILIPRLTEWCFADMGAPAIDEGEVNLESKRVTTPGEGAGLPARLRPIVWRNVGKHVTKSEGWKTLLKAHTRHVAQTVVAVAGRSSEPLLAKGDEVTGREDRLQRSQGGSSGAEDLPAGGVKTGKESDEAAAPPDLREDNPMPSGDPADEQVPERVEAMMEGGVANLPAKGDGRQSKADACGRQEEACGRQSLVGSSWESDGQGPKSNGCRPETDGGGRRPAATLSSPRNTGKPSSVQKAGVLGVNPSLDPSQPGGHGRGPKSASEQGEDDAELQQPGVLLALSPTSEADLLRGPELGHGFGSSRRLSSEEELCRIAPNSASSPTAESPASGYETLKCFNALLAKLRTGDLLPQTGPSCTQETWDKENVCGAWEGSCEPGRLVANGENAHLIQKWG